MKFTRPLLLCLVLLMPLALVAQDAAQEEGRAPADRMSEATFRGLRLRSIGPALTSGRISALAVDPKDSRVWWVAAASGGVWKTTNAGTTFTPVFDNEGSYSIGAVTIDPNNSSVVWVGSGENNSQRSVGYGDGVYRTEDGGRSWRNMGLKASEHIGKILVDPRDSNIVYVAAQGPLWGPGGDRGLYKSTDGGKNWKAILTVSENTGVTDIAFDPRNPDVIYAAAYQRRRHFFTLINGGPESAIHKSTDGGATWTRLRSGLPNVDTGRIGLAVSPADPDTLYATIEAADGRGGIFRSANRGATWERRNEFDTTAMYYGKIFADPKDKDRLYVMNVQIRVSDDGGRTLQNLGERAKHVDNHAMWIDPANTDHYLVGCDGGLYESWDRAATWNFKANLPITQFYNIFADTAKPFYYVYGGTQDNFSLGGPSRTRSASGILNSDWFVTQGGDGFRSVVDPQDPNTIYAESQHGGLVRFDKRTGQRIGIKPQEGKGEPPLRWNWDAPLIISPHSHTRLYFAANLLFRSDDRGDTWRKVSGELSRGIDRNALPVMGRVWGPDAVAKNASTAFYGNASIVAESPKKEGLLFVGTDDGLLHITENAGQSWRKIEKFAGVPENAYVTHVLPSQHDVNTVYVVFNNHQNADFAPYILKSTDLGKTWTPLKGNLPANSPLWVVVEDHVNANLLFLGTEFGLWFSNDGGQKWVRLRGTFPTIAVRDLAIQKERNDLVVGTFGRGIYILDDYTPLRALKSDHLSQEAHLFATGDAEMFIVAQPLGGGQRGFQGESLYTAANPAFGATLTFYLKDAYRTKKQQRQRAEREAVRANKAIEYPSVEQLRAEDEEEAPSVFVTITDDQGNVIRRIPASNSAGMQRVTWDLRFPATSLTAGGGRRDDDDDDDGPRGTPSSYLVMPGAYQATLSKRIAGKTAQIAGPVPFNVTVEGVSAMLETDRKALFDFQQQVARLQRAVIGALDVANSTRAKLGQMQRAIQETPAATDKLRDEARALDTRLNTILIALRGDIAMRRRNENTSPSISERVNSIVGGQRLSTSRPTQTHRDAYRIAAEEFAAELAKLRALVETDVAKLEKQLEAIGAPYTPGRLPEWKQP